MHALLFWWYLQEAPREHTYLSIFQRRLEFSRWKSLEIRIFCITKIRLAEIFEEKGTSMQFY